MIKEVIPFNLLEDENVSPLLDAIEEELNGLLRQISIALIYPKIDELPENIIDLLAYQFHIEGYDIAESISEKRNFVKNAILAHRHKGTKWAIKKVLEIVGLDGEVKEWFETGDAPYTFSVSLSGEISDDTPIAKLIDLINEYKNVRSKLVRFDFKSIKTLKQLFIDSSMALEIEPQSLFIAQKNILNEIRDGSVFDADFGVARFNAAVESRNAGAFSTNDLNIKFKPDIPLEPVHTDIMPNDFVTVLELNDEGSASIFREYFTEDGFLLRESLSLTANATAIINLEV
ncbi:phage tail protein I [Deferribacter autotrophicus]|uniref:Phage tail protein I n=1 Tax=Deferribacter autotrophicus TaxID=500465 RepID=A0A5A8F1G5_9BACT|nr:phage tail protein I [Deferribacter autotrophicus]KAA0257231.1 phage tail protein I [Deferribacter autotrophicus]